MDIQVLPLSEVWERHSEKVVFTPDFTESDFDREWQTVRDALRSKLQASWRESCYGDADFALSDDRSNTWAQAGGIQREKMLTRDFARLVFDVLATQPHSDRWGVLFSVNIKTELLRLRAVNGEILFKSGVLYIAEYKSYDHDAILRYFSEPCA